MILILNWWEKCKEPKWIHRERLYGNTLYVRGYRYKYKIVGQPDWSQGHDPTICYRKYRNWYVKKLKGEL